MFITADQGNADAFKKIGDKAGVDAAIVVEGKYDSALCTRWESGMQAASIWIRSSNSRNRTAYKNVVIDSPHLWSSSRQQEVHVRSEYVKTLVDGKLLKLKKTGSRILPIMTVQAGSQRRGRNDGQRDPRRRRVELKEMRWNKKDAKCLRRADAESVRPEIAKKIA